MRFVWLVALLGCADEYALEVKTSFMVTEVTGAGVSPLDPLAGQVIDIHIAWPAVDSNHGDGNDPAGCKSTVLGFRTSERTATGPTAMLVQTEILDKLAGWEVRLQLCEAGSGMSSLVIVAVINELNLSFGCFGVPEAAKVSGSDGYPAITSMTATGCRSTILDVVNNRVFGNSNFPITIVTGPSSLP